MEKMPVKKKSSALKTKTTSGAAAGPVQDKIQKMPGLNKGTDITLKRGAILAGKPAVVKKDAVEMKKLPGKKKPPTLTLKRDVHAKGVLAKKVIKKGAGKKK